MKEMENENKAENSLEMRKSNIELLRIVAMFGIVIFHHFGTKMPNGMVALSEGFGKDSYFYDFVNNSTAGLDIKTLIFDFLFGHLGNGGNLIFMLITGYFLFGREFGIEKRVKAAKKVLCITLFWGVVLAIVYGILAGFFYPMEGLPSYKPSFNLFSWLCDTNTWYLQAYGVFILLILPILKYFESKIDKKKHWAIIVMLVALCFFDYASFLPNIWISIYLLEFTLCYYIGGYIAKYPNDISLWKLFAMFFGYMALYFVYEFAWRSSMRKMYEPHQYSYVSVMQPFICCLIYAVLLFMIFEKMNFKSKVINRIAKATPGIYLFHFNLINTVYVIANTFWWKDWSLGGFCKFILIDAVLLFAAGLLIDCVYPHRGRS
ncbi:MAG: acyltransferase [Lachnospiraceae bacterium]|nr:acyltransferase [Lachnospiraceae bacterium]